MLSTLSVKKPYTVLVAVALVLVLGIISFTSMTTDLLPSIELPYIIVMTTYPGASPEKVEATVTKPLEAVLGTTGGVKNVQSVSNENASIVILEFEQGSNMDSAMIELSGNIDLVAGSLDEAVGAPMMLKISPDMLPVMVASVDLNGMDVREVSAYVEQSVIPAFERLDGVASVDATGLVQAQVTVQLDQNRIDAINDKVLASVDSGLADAQKQLRDAQAKLNSGKLELANGQSALNSNKDSMTQQLANGSAQVDAAAAQLAALLSEEKSLEINAKAFTAERDGYQTAVDGYTQLNSAIAALADASNPLYPLLLAAVGGDAAQMPTGVAALLSLPDTSFTAYLTVLQTYNVPGLSTLTKESLQQLSDANAAASTRLPQVEAELANIKTRQMVVAAMKPELEAALKQVQDTYAKIESGKMTAVNELTKGEITLSDTQAQLKTAEEQLKTSQEELDAARDAAYKKADISGALTAEIIGNILMAENFGMPAGYITEHEEQYLVKVGEQYADMQEVADTLLFNIDVEGVGDVRLSDVATVEITDNASESYAKVNGNDGVILSFQKQSTASTASVSGRINDAIDTLQAANPDLHITALMDQGDYIDLVVGSVLSNLLWGGLLAILVLALFLKDFRPTAIVACSIPFSLLCAITAMYFSNVTLNIISLSGLALGVGMLVDNSIVVIENIYRLRSEGMPAAQAAVTGAKQVAGAIFASTLTTICVFVPIVFTEGISRQLFTDMGLTIAYSLLASLFVALTLVPAMGATALKNTREKEHRWFDAFRDAYGKVLRWSLRNKAIVLGVVAALLIFSVFEATQMGTAFMPEMNSPQMSATLTMPKETTKADTYEMSDTVMERISAIEGIENVGAMEGGSGGLMAMGGGASSQNSISFYILLGDDTKQSNQEIANAISTSVQDLDCELTVETSTMDMSALGGSGIEMVIEGQNLDTMGEIAEDMRALLREVEGISDISESKVTGNRETRIIVDKDKAMQHSLTVAQVYAELANALKSETTATTLSMGGTDYPVVIVQDENDEITRKNIMKHPFTVKNKDGEDEIIHLYEIADSVETDSVSAINRANGTRTMSVTAGVDAEHNIGLVSRELEKKLANYAVPDGYSVEITGENETINSAMGDLALMLLLAIVFIYLIMVAQFQSLMSPFIVMFTIPLAFTGGLLALWITGSELSIVSVLGFLVLSGVVVNNGIVFVDTINQLRLEGATRREAIVQTGRMRLRPVLMTALTTILAMSTMALGVGQGAEMTQPMAIVTIGGLSYATVLTLVVVPVLYDIFRKKDLRKVEVE